MKHSLKISKTDAGSEGLLSFEGDMTLIDAREIKDALLEAIGKVDTLNLDINKVGDVDVSFLQLVCAAHRECFLSGKEIFLQDTPDRTMKKLLSRAGYIKHQGCPIDAEHTCLCS